MVHLHIDMDRRTVDVEEKKYLIDTEIVTETQGNMGEWTGLCVIITTRL